MLFRPRLHQRNTRTLPANDWTNQPARPANIGKQHRHGRTPTIARRDPSLLEFTGCRHSPHRTHPCRNLPAANIRRRRVGLAAARRPQGGAIGHARVAGAPRALKMPCARGFNGIGPCIQALSQPRDLNGIETCIQAALRWSRPAVSAARFQRHRDLHPRGPSLEPPDLRLRGGNMFPML